MTATVYGDVLTSNLLPDAVRTIYAQELEWTSRPMLVYDQPFLVEKRDNFEQQRGNTVVWTVYHQLPPTIQPLSQNQDVAKGAITDHQVSFQVQEYGTAIGTTEYLDLVSYHGAISDIVTSALAPQQALTMDTLCRNAFWYAPNLILTDSTKTGPTHLGYTGGAPGAPVTSRFGMTPALSLLASDTAKQAAYHLTVRRVPTIGEQVPCYVCITHASALYDMRNDLLWKDAQFYAGSTRIFNGEVGMIHGVRFITSDQARIANGGAIYTAANSGAGVAAFQGYQTTLSAAYAAGVNTFQVASVAGMHVGDEITFHTTGIAASVTGSGGTAVNWTAPDGRDASMEMLIVRSVNSGNNTFTTTEKSMIAHSAADFVTDALDVYPMIFQGGEQCVGKGILVDPEIRVALPVDTLRRIYSVGWYALLGYGVTREHGYELVETLASQNTPPPYGY